MATTEEILQHYGVLGMRWGKSGKRGHSKLGYNPNAKAGKNGKIILDPQLQIIANQRYDRQKAGKLFSHSPQETIMKVFRNQPKKSQTDMQVLLNMSYMDVHRSNKELMRRKIEADKK